MRARFGRMINPLCEKTRSMGADDTGAQNTFKQWLQLRKLSTHCGHGHVFLEFWEHEFADVK